jgi:hypothetical protein
MINIAIVVGTVVEAFEERGATFVVLKIASGSKQSGGSWEELVACRFWGDAVKYAQKCEAGALVRVDGSIKSRKGDKGGWFTGFEARFASVIAPSTAVAPKATSKAAEAAAHGYDSDVPF